MSPKAAYGSYKSKIIGHILSKWLKLYTWENLHKHCYIQFYLIDLSAHFFPWTSVSPWAYSKFSVSTKYSGKELPYSYIHNIFKLPVSLDPVCWKLVNNKFSTLLTLQMSFVSPLSLSWIDTWSNFSLKKGHSTYLIILDCSLWSFIIRHNSHNSFWIRKS